MITKRKQKPLQHGIGEQEMSKELKDEELSLNKGLGRLGSCALAGFLVWCTFHYEMSDTMRLWFYVWAVFQSFN